MVNIIIPGILPSVRQVTIDELLLDFEDPFKLLRARLKLFFENHMLDSTIRNFQNCVGSNQKQKDLAEFVALIIYYSIRREGIIIDHNYTMPTVEWDTFREQVLSKFRKNFDESRNNVFADMKRENGDLYEYVWLKASYDNAMYGTGLVKNLSAIMYDLIQQQERQRALAILDKAYEAVAPLNYVELSLPIAIRGGQQTK
ncbi:MAG TPA: hypothetical protein VJJ52_01545 [Candidatus Nanoarchaeia archaeon]|nr:hypothetical protein [Candidatus Nanoarchaeia archaeon]